MINKYTYIYVHTPDSEPNHDGRWSLLSFAYGVDGFHYHHPHPTDHATLKLKLVTRVERTSSPWIVPLKRRWRIAVGGREYRITSHVHTL